jgi:hypothetical protein
MLWKNCYGNCALENRRWEMIVVDGGPSHICRDHAKGRLRWHGKYKHHRWPGWMVYSRRYGDPMRHEHPGRYGPPRRHGMDPGCLRHHRHARVPDGLWHHRNASPSSLHNRDGIIRPIKDYADRGAQCDRSHISVYLCPLVLSPLGSSVLKPNLQSGKKDWFSVLNR